VSALLADKKNQLWVGTYRGLIRFSNGFPETNKGDVLLPGMLITSLKEDLDGSLVVGTFKGLFRLRDSTVEPITEKDGLSNNFILSVSIDSFGGVWVGTKAGGIDWVRGHQVIHASPNLGIPSYSVFSVLDDRRGQFWMSTNRGLLRVPSQDMYDLVTNSRKTENAVLLGKSDGMRSGECSGASQPPAGRTLDGTLWFATAKGFVHTHTNPSDQPFAVPATKPYISSLTVNESPLATSDELSLPAGPNDFAIQFGAVRLANPWQVQFRYKLEGYDRDWTTTWARHARYQHLAPGRYRFLVGARDAGQLWNGQVATLLVVQRPFFYQTSWFYLVVGLTVVGVVVLLFRWRLARLHQGLRLVMEERNRIAREWHDTLMAGLAAISWQLEATRERLIKNPGEATSFLDLARKMARHSQAEARRIIWDLQDSSESSGPLSEAVSSALKRLGATAEITPELRVNGVEASLSPLAVHHLVRICQEAVTNAVRHASPTSILVDLDYQPSTMTLSVKDNGRGFPSNKATVPGHFGLTVMEERARKLGGTLRVQSSPGAGTEIFVKVPVESGTASV
jgi:signal transduction histidine kinase